MNAVEPNNSIVIYQTNDGETSIDVKFQDETVWLSQAQMAELFQKDRTVIGRHINNIFKEGELDETLVCAKFTHTKEYGRREGFTQKTETKLYNLDVIISVGYRVKSQRGTQFRIWANKILKRYLLQGYAINERIASQKYDELSQLPLPVGSDWIEHLDLLRAIRINSFGRFPNIEDFIARQCEDFAEVGIKKDSDTYNDAIKLLSSCGLRGIGVFVDNPVLTDYVRINISSKNEIDTLSLHNNIAGQIFVIPLNDSQKKALRSIRDKYSKDAQLLKQMKDWVVKQWGLFDNLNRFGEWWKQIPISFDITAAGRILANANANRIDSSLAKIQ